MLVPPSQVVTSFPSKSELGLHIARDWRGAHLVFMGYANAGIGALDASNTDTVPGQDPTNPVSFAFGADYAFHRTIVSMDSEGRLSYTPTVNYGGNNGRSALLGSNGLYYTVGNSNNGNAATFGSNGTHPDVTETTGLEVVKPINARTVNVSIPDGNAGSQKITVVPGFPTDAARSTGGNFTPFAIFFANATTMYVADEGTGSSVDATTHAGLEKWTLVNGTWQLDYVLTKGLVGMVDDNLFGYDGQYPDVTTIGLRNLTGVVNRDGTVTLWATTSSAHSTMTSPRPSL
jgi:hypothetical protein